MRARAEDEVGARVDRDAREVAAVAAVLAERLLRAVGHVRLLGALGARVEEADDDVGLRAAARTSVRTAASSLIGELHG